jgi:hypothetical protein
LSLVDKVARNITYTNALDRWSDGSIGHVHSDVNPDYTVAAKVFSEFDWLILRHNEQVVIYISQVMDFSDMSWLHDSIVNWPT